MLNERHRAELRASGLTDETIAASGIYSATRSEAAEFLGFDPDSDGWVVTYRGTEADGAAFRRFKPDRPFDTGNGKPAKYLSPKKEKYPAGNRLYIPENLDRDVLTDSSRPLIVTEGEKKALAATQEGFAAVALAGVACWVGRNGDGASAPIHDLDLIDWNGRPTTIVFDSDATTKTPVKREEGKLAEELRGRGASVRIARLPKPKPTEDLQFGLRGKFGLDDFLRVRGRAALQAVLEQAKAPKEATRTEQESAADLAERFLAERHLRGRLRWWHGDFYRFEGAHFAKVEHHEVEALVIGWQQRAEGTRHLAGTHLTTQVLANLTALTAIPPQVRPPAWIDGRGEDARNLVVLANGIITIDDLIAAKMDGLRAHSPNLFTLTSIPHPLSPDVDCPGWIEFLEEALPDPEIRDLVQALFGYCLVHDTKQEKFALLHGSGADGKTVVCTVLRELLGQGSVSAVGLEALNPARTFPLAAMDGKLANIVEEMGEIERSAEGVLKQLVTGSPITVERKHRDPYEMYPTARLIFATNVLPRICDRTDGTWRRMLLVPFRRQILDESEQDKRLIDGSFWRESGELSGVLLWAVAGLAALHARGRFLEPAACRAAKAVYRQEANPTATFLAETCEARAGCGTSAPELYALYRSWIEANGYRALGHQHFAEEVRRAFRGVESSKNPRPLNGKRVRVWEGLTLR